MHTDAKKWLDGPPVQEFGAWTDICDLSGSQFFYFDQDKWCLYFIILINFTMLWTNSVHIL